MNRFDVIGFGALNVDKLFRVNKIAGAEEEGFITDCDESCGGSAANTVVGLARLHRRVGFLGKVADDREGKMLVKSFQKEGVDTSEIIHARHGRSGTVMGFVNAKGDRALYVDPGVNDTIGFAEIGSKYVFQTRFLHLTSFVGEKSFQTQKQLVKTLPKSVKLSLDPGELYARKGLTTLEPLIQRTFVLMPNHLELELLTGVADYKRGAKALFEKSVGIVAVKLGGKGCYVTDGRESFHIKPFKAKVIDTTGAGDAFDAGFLYGMLEGKSLYECGRIGNFVASRCIMKMGARTGLPRLEDLKLLS